MRVGPLDDGYVLPRFHHFVWFERGQLAGSHSGCDARGIWLDQYTLLAVYNEMTIFPHYKQGDPLYPGSGNNRVHMYALNLSAGKHTRPIQLKLVGLPSQVWEKNWAPFVHNGELFMSYKLRPQHLVLRCKLSAVVPGAAPPEVPQGPGDCSVAHASAHHGASSPFPTGAARPWGL
jgi:hypothetical protein